MVTEDVRGYCYPRIARDTGRVLMVLRMDWSEFAGLDKADVLNTKRWWGLWGEGSAAAGPGGVKRRLELALDGARRGGLCQN